MATAFLQKALHSFSDRKIEIEAIWIEGCAGGLGLENLNSIFERPLIDLKKDQISENF